MKNYDKKLKSYDIQHTVFIKHEWGQNKHALYNSLAKAWNKIDVGGKIVLTSYKHFGLKNALEFFKTQGLDYSIVGKGTNNLRLIEFIKSTNHALSLIEPQKPTTFNFRGQQYQVNIGNAIFSKQGLDLGTRFLLEVFFNQKLDLNQKRVSDFGAGWGAISLIFAHEFPDIKIIAYEKDDASFAAAKTNLHHYPTVKVIKADLTKYSSDLFQSQKNEFDYLFCNLPLHSTHEDKVMTFQNAHNLLKDKGEIFFVTEKSFTHQFKKVAQGLFTLIEEKGNELYTVSWYQKLS